MNYTIIKADKSNLSDLYDVSAAMHGEKQRGYFEKSIDLSTHGERDVFLIQSNNSYVGYVMLSYNPKYGYYRAHNIPEIQDLNIIPDYRQRGLGRAMIEHCEKVVRQKNCSIIGIGVGVTPSYGAAQRLYTKMGYIPDGFGITYDRKTISAGEVRPFDDDVSLMLEKAL